MQIDYQKVDDNLSVLGKHINNAYSQFGNVSTGLTSLGQKLHSTNALQEKVENSE